MSGTATMRSLDSKNFLFEFRSNNSVKRREEATSSMIRHRWDPPNEGDYKANCDSVFDSLDSRIGVGIAIRDSRGNVLASCSQVFEATFRIKIAKLMAILKCLQFGYDCGLTLRLLNLMKPLW
ncbi:hypothetical protein Ddye_015315 [Dipteronia dyeriana]|uniref:RNase H type-1 domain-containing protein n=1 Tax=Dipteronia dyeriana TaxID=168575 RepID=A0AAD9U5D7_9ROSI|nr:hypothetical protein Ddye_015315 [Dipteronia dyeriana]